MDQCRSWLLIITIDLNWKTMLAFGAVLLATGYAELALYPGPAGELMTRSLVAAE